MITKTSKVRNKLTGQIFEVIPGSLLPEFFEEVTDDRIKVGEPKVEFEIEEMPEKVAESLEERAEKPATREEKETRVLTEKAKTVKTGKKSKKGVKKDGSTKRN